MPLPVETINTSLKAWGTSRAVRIPKSMCEYALISVGSELTMESGCDEKGRYIVLRPFDQGAHKSYADVPTISMDAAFEGYEGDYVPSECDWGEDVGDEVVA